MRTPGYIIALTALALLTGCATAPPPQQDEAKRLEFCKEVSDAITPSDPLCGRFFDQIRAEQPLSKSVKVPERSSESVNTGQTRVRPPVLSRETDLESRAVDEIQRFDKWSGEGPAPQPIRAMEDMWRCNKYGDC